MRFETKKAMFWRNKYFFHFQTRCKKRIPKVNERQEILFLAIFPLEVLGSPRKSL